MLGKASLTETQCWISGLGPGRKCPRWRPQAERVLFQEKKAAVSAALGGREGPGNGGRGGRPRPRQAPPGPARPHRPGEDFGVLSRAVTSQGL